MGGVSSWHWGPLSASLTHTEPPQSPLSQVSLFDPPVCEPGPGLPADRLSVHVRPRALAGPGSQPHFPSPSRLLPPGLPGSFSQPCPPYTAQLWQLLFWGPHSSLAMELTGSTCFPAPPSPRQTHGEGRPRGALSPGLCAQHGGWHRAGSAVPG